MFIESFLFDPKANHSRHALFNIIGFVAYLFAVLLSFVYEPNDVGAGGVMLVILVVVSRCYLYQAIKWYDSLFLLFLLMLPVLAMNNPGNGWILFGILMVIVIGLFYWWNITERSYHMLIKFNELVELSVKKADKKKRWLVSRIEYLASRYPAQRPLFETLMRSLPQRPSLLLINRDTLESYVRIMSDLDGVVILWWLINSPMGCDGERMAFDPENFFIVTLTELGGGAVPGKEIFFYGGGLSEKYFHLLTFFNKVISFHKTPLYRTMVARMGTDFVTFFNYEEEKSD